MSRNPEQNALFSLTAAGICSSDSRRRVHRHHSLRASLARRRGREIVNSVVRLQRRRFEARGYTPEKCEARALPKDAFRAAPPADRVSRGSTPNPLVKLEPRRARRDSHSFRLLSYFCRNMRKYCVKNPGYLSHAAIVDNSYRGFCEFLNKSVLKKNTRGAENEISNVNNHVTRVCIYITITLDIYSPSSAINNNSYVKLELSERRCVPPVP